MHMGISERDKGSVEALLGRTVAPEEVLLAVLVEAVAETARRVMDLESHRGA